MKVSVSPKDDEDEVQRAVDSVIQYADDVGVRNLVIFPFAHLFEELAEPQHGLEIIDELERKLSDSKKFSKVSRVPFGWYKEYTIESTGHRLSATSRDF